MSQHRPFFSPSYFRSSLVLLWLVSASAASALPSTRLDVLRPVDPGFGPVPVVAFSSLDRGLLELEDRAREANGEPYRFAVRRDVYLTPESAGLWDVAPSGEARWRLRVTAEQAHTLNFGFSRFELPSEARLIIFAADGSTMLGPFTVADNSPNGSAVGQLWTPVLLASDAVIELTVPEAQRGGVRLALSAINQGYRGLGLSGPDKSGSCNVDVECPEGDSYRDVIRSVARITIGGVSLCSGAMINNTSGDFRPLFLTAAHCGINSNNASSVVSYWLFENSTCRPPGSGASGGPGDGSLGKTLSGAVLRATYTPGDSTLIEFNASPPSGHRVHWAGWDRSGGNPSRSVAIHHPRGDEKRISFDDQPASTTSYLSSSGGDGTHIRIADWDLGTTEGGSSGSPLLNQNRRIVGQLHGGFAACGNNDADWYGRLSVAWTGGGSSSNRLSDWLDPTGTGATSIAGGQPGDPPPPQTPTAPSNLTATVLSGTEVRLNWQDNSNNENDFVIEGRVTGGSYSTFGTSAANTTSKIVTGLTAGTSYDFRLRSRNGAGSSGSSNAVTVVTLGGLPSMPTNFRARTLAPNIIRFDWIDSSSTETEFEIELVRIANPASETAGAGTGVSFAQSGFVLTTISAAPNTQSFTFDIGVPGTTYTARMRARSAAGNSAYTSKIAVTTKSASPLAGCTVDEFSLCLRAGRFRVESFWNNVNQPGVRGDAHSEPESDQTGFFWFFNPANIELVAKVLDGSAINGNFWAFYGGLSDVEYWIVVTDTQTGERTTYYNAPGNFCGNLDTGAIPAASALIEESAAAAARQHPSSSAPTTGAAQSEPVSEASSGRPRGSAVARQDRSSSEVFRGSCVPTANQLCLFNNRFAVTVAWNAPGVGTGVGGAVPDDDSDKTGFFWFFNAANIELVLKVLDGRAINGKFWFFYGALSDVQYTITVTDTTNGAMKTYTNPQGNICGQADTGAFNG